MKLRPFALLPPTPMPPAGGRRNCPAHLYQCGSGDCVLPDLVCDRVRNCVDGSDEGNGCLHRNCTHLLAAHCERLCVSTPGGPVSALHRDLIVSLSRVPLSSLFVFCPTPTEVFLPRRLQTPPKHRRLLRHQRMCWHATRVQTRLRQRTGLLLLSVPRRLLPGARRHELQNQR